MNTKSCMGAAFLRECFDADFEVGSLIWRRRPESHFTSVRSCAAWNGRNAGKAAGGPNQEGYMAVWVRYLGKRHGLLAHRVLWCMRTGEWPESTIDHRNCVRTDNRQVNLRPATHTEQNANRPAIRSGLKGVTFDKTTSRYVAQITRNGCNHFLGRYDTEAEGNAAYEAAALKLHGEFART